MPKFRAEFDYMTPGWGEVEFDADDKDQMEFLTLNYVRDTFDGASDVNITDIEEII